MAELGITKADLSRRADVPYDNINKWLRGEVDNPRGDGVKRVAAVIGMTEQELRFGASPQEAPPIKGKFPNGLAAAMKRAGIGPTELAEKVGTNKQNISRWADGERKLPPEWAKKISPAVGRSPADLLFDMKYNPHEEPPGRDDFDYSTEEDRAPDEAHGRTIPEFDVRAHGSYGGGMDASGEWTSGDITQEVNAHRPIARWGFPEAFIESELGLSYGGIDILKVEGPSMDDGSQYALRDGDRVMVNRRNRNYRQGGIFAIWDGDGTIIKQVEAVRGSDPPAIRCTSLNKSYTPFDLILDGNVHIIGRVSLKISRM